MTERFRIRTAGDLEAVTISETFHLLSDVFGPYCFTVSGDPGEQQALFMTEAHHRLFISAVQEFIAEATDVTEGQDGIPRNLSLFGAGLWLIGQHAEEAESANWTRAATELERWLDRPVRIRFWSGEIWRHVEYEAPFKRTFTAHANLIKHGLLKLGPEIRSLRAACAAGGAELSEAEAVAAIPEYAAHIQGMMEYHATEVAELAGEYFFGLYRFVRTRWERTPTNHLDRIPPPPGVTDDVFRYLYASTLFQFSGWTEARIRGSIPGTGRHLRRIYPQHEGRDPESD